MTIGIIAAMTKELNLLLPLMASRASETRCGTVFHTGTIGDHHVVAMECGIGKVNAAIGAVTLIDNYRPDLVVNTGVAAGAGPEVGVMDTVVATGVAHHDFWCLGEDWGRVPGCPTVFPTLEAACRLLPESPGVCHGPVVSGEQFITKAAQVDEIRSHYPEARAIDMESAAIGQACWTRSVPYVCLRVISDTPWCHHDNAAQYGDFWDAAPRQSFALVSRLIQGL